MLPQYVSKLDQSIICFVLIFI